MIREEFNKLDINSQVNYFNNELKNKDNNFNAICKQLGISKNTILSRFKKEGLLPVKEGQKIIGFNNQLLEIKEENLTAENSEVKNIIPVLPRSGAKASTLHRAGIRSIHCPRLHRCRSASYCLLHFPGYSESRPRFRFLLPGTRPFPPRLLQ